MTKAPSKHTGNKGFWQTFLKRLLFVVFKVVLPVAIILAGVGFYKHQMDTRPLAQRRPAQRDARLVTVEQVHASSRPAIVQAMGTVRPAVEIALTPEVSGIVTYRDAAVLPGGIVHEGQVLYRIDSRDYDAVVRQRQSDLARAELELRLELANQAVAQQEYEMLNEEIGPQDREMVLRKPQLESARQALEGAQAALNRAKLDVQRCTIAAPFNAVVKAKHIDLGARVSTTTSLATLTGTDAYWIQALVPMEQLQWIRFPDSQGQDGSVVRIYNPSAWPARQYRRGQVLRLMGQLEVAGRMAQVLISVCDPLSLEDGNDQPPLLVGMYVRADIEGRPVSDAVALPRAYLRDGSTVWVMNDDNALEIRDVEIIFRGREAVYVTAGLLDGERVVSSDLSAPVAGMPLRLDDEIDIDIEEAMR